MINILQFRAKWYNAADYNIKVLTIDKNHEIKVWDDPNDFGSMKE